MPAPSTVPSSAGAPAGERMRADFGVPEAEGLDQGAPGRLQGLLGDAHQLEARAGPAAEMREIGPENAEEGRPSRLGHLVLAVPIVGAGEPAVDDAHDAGAAVPGLDRPFA